MSENLVILAPGSMTHILPSLLVEYHSLKPPSIHCEFGPSGSLRAKIEAGKHYHLFLSATTTHTQDLFHSDHLSKHDVLGYNRMVLLHRRSIDVRQETVLSHLVDSTRILGMSTTGLDPAGDYALEILKNVSVATKTSLADLAARTRIITGGRETPNAPPGRNQYGWIMETQNVDLLLTYYSNALAAMDDNPHVGFCDLPESIGMTGTYGIGVAKNTTETAFNLYRWLLSKEAQNRLADSGFIPRMARD